MGIQDRRKISRPAHYTSKDAVEKQEKSAYQNLNKAGYGFHAEMAAAQFEEAAKWRVDNLDPLKAAENLRNAAKSIEYSIKGVEKVVDDFETGKEKSGKIWEDIYRTDLKELKRRAKFDKSFADRLEKVAKGQWRGFGYKVNVALIIVGLLGGTLFLSSNITGNVIGLSQTSTNWIGGVLFLIGLVGAFAYFKRR